MAIGKHETDEFPLISVVMPSYNSEQYIEEAIQSVLDQTYRNFELIVIDDGSQDNTTDLVGRYGNRVSLSIQPNMGPGAARNNGIRQSRGSLICFLDSDDVWVRDKLRKQLLFIKSNPHFGLICSDIATFDETGILEPRFKARHYPIANGYVLDQLLFSNWLQTSAVMVKKECLETYAFDEERGLFGEDWILWMQLAARYQIGFMPEPLVKYRVRPASFSRHAPDEQFYSLFRGIEKLRQTIPELASRPNLIKRWLFQVCIQRAGVDIRNRGMRAATRKLCRALSYRPYSLKAWAMLMASLCPPVTRLALLLQRRLLSAP